MNFKKEFRFTDCRDKLPLPFDFAILDNNKKPLLLIEYDGIQHFKSVEIFGGKNEFKKIQKRDDI